MKGIDVLHNLLVLADGTKSSKVRAILRLGNVQSTFKFAQELTAEKLVADLISKFEEYGISSISQEIINPWSIQLTLERSSFAYEIILKVLSSESRYGMPSLSGHPQVVVAGSGTSILAVNSSWTDFRCVLNRVFLQRLLSFCGYALQDHDQSNSLNLFKVLNNPTTQSQCNVTNIASDKCSISIGVAATNQESPSPHSNITFAVQPVLDLSKKKDVNSTLSDIINHFLNLSNDKAVSGSNLQSIVDLAAKLSFINCKVSSPLLQPIKEKDSFFIIYNAARASALVQKYEELKEKKLISYQDVADLKSEDLTQDEHKVLIKIFEFPLCINSLHCNILDGRLSSHKLFRYLIDLSHTFSKYYRNNRIFKESSLRSETIHSKMAMVVAVLQVFKTSFSLLDSECPTKM